MGILIPQNLKDHILQRLMSRYIVGYTVEAALSAAQRIAALGWQATICPWNFAHDPPEKVAAAYRESIEKMAQSGLNGYVSIKAPALHYNFDLLQEVLAVAEQYHMRVHFDSQDPGSADATFALIDRALRVYPNVSCTLPSGWLRSQEDVHRVIDRGIAVRLVKGQWPDPQIPDFDASAGYFRLAEKLAGRGVHVDIASHDADLVLRALSLLKKSNTSCHLELLYGLPLRPARIARQLGVGVTLYIPFGRACLPYDIYVLRRRPVILKWMLRDLVLGNHFQLPA